MAIVQKQAAKDREEAKKRFEMLEKKQEEMKLMIMDVQKMRRHAKEQQDYAIHTISDATDALRQDLILIRNDIDGEKKNQSEAMERLRHSQRIAHEAHQRFSADFGQIKTAVLDQSQSVADVQQELRQTRSNIEAVKGIYEKVLPGLEEPLYSTAQLNAQNALKEIDKLKKHYRIDGAEKENK